MSPHSLRHAAITNALDAGVPLRDAQILARHSDPRTTEHYKPCPRKPRPPRSPLPHRLRRRGLERREGARRRGHANAHYDATKMTQELV
ncbi:tyrosine-type recombinase/integrase [Nocardioides sp. GCM10028917]|uniref:tyrosine-type recombinase/integrase n=1 Tax=Nocardioides sp. GCM10028917 TaxID=3273408 RepID=UPI00360EBA13